MISNRRIETREDSPREGAWVLVQLKAPGRDLAPVGVLLLDSASDTVSMSFRELIDEEKENEDIVEFWAGFEEMLRDVVSESGGRATLLWLESLSSHTIQISALTPVDVSHPNLLRELFQRHVAVQLIEPRFGREQIAAALTTLPTLPSFAIRVISTLNNPRVSVRDIEVEVSRDPVSAAHIMRLANSASMPFREEVRTLGAAIQRIGIDLTKTQVLACAVQKMFASTKLKQVWNHSLEAAQRARQIARLAKMSIGEASLLGLVHDVGQIAFSSLPAFDLEYARLQEQGLTGIAIEEQLCGVTHAQAGADLLASWGFPFDMCEAIRIHHSHLATRNANALSALLYLTEAGLEVNEDIYEWPVYRESLKILGIGDRSLGPHNYLDADLQALRASA